MLVRRIAKLEYDAASMVFSAFINEQALTQAQIVFVKKTIDYVVQNGYIEHVSELTKPPLDKPQNFIKLFDESKWKRLVELVTRIKDIVKLMAIFFVPYKTIVRRLYEIQYITEKQMTRLLDIPDRDPNRGVLLQRKILQMNDTSQNRTGEMAFELWRIIMEMTDYKWDKAIIDTDFAFKMNNLRDCNAIVEYLSVFVGLPRPRGNQ